MRLHWIAALGVLVMSLISSGCRGFIENQVFFPERGLVATPASAGLGSEDVWFPTADGLKLHGWLVAAVDARFLVVFCHGNAGNISHRVDNLRRLHELGVATFIFDYRGYGQSQGRPSEEGFFRDAEAAADEAQRLAQRLRLRVVVFGRSLGGVAATHMAARGRPAGLILESTFTHLGDMARSLVPLPLLAGALKNRFSALDRVGRVQAPILFFHGDRDEIVPLDLGRRLYAAAPEPKRWVTLAGAGHNDTYLVGGAAYWQAWQDFLAGL
ncbi:MAG: alpha/beta hydrolase [Pseudomonadota bacterium]